MDCQNLATPIEIKSPVLLYKITMHLHEEHTKIDLNFTKYVYMRLFLLFLI